MDDISNKEGEAFAAFQVGDTVVHHNLPRVHDGVGVGGVGGCPPAKVDPTPTRRSLSGNLASFVACTPLTRILLTSLMKVMLYIFEKTMQSLVEEISGPVQAWQDLPQPQPLPTE